MKECVCVIPLHCQIEFSNQHDIQGGGDAALRDKPQRQSNVLLAHHHLQEPDVWATGGQQLIDILLCKYIEEDP